MEENLEGVSPMVKHYKKADYKEDEKNDKNEKEKKEEKNEKKN